MTPKMQKLAKEAFEQGIIDEDNSRYQSCRLTIDRRVRNFYDAARKQRAEQLRPEREAEQKARAEKQRKVDLEAYDRMIAAIPAIKANLAEGDSLGACRLIMNAQIGI